MGVVYSSARFAMRGALRLFGDWQVEGTECVPPRGPLIVVSNHQSNMDPPMIMASLPRRVRFMAKRGIFNGPILSFLLHAYGAFPLNRDGGDLQAIQWSLKMLDSGAAIGIFPEGTRSPGGMRQGIPGIAMIAIKSGAPILPMGMTGTERTGPPWQVAMPRGEFRVKIGQPFSLPTIEGRVGREQLQSMTDMIMQRVAALLPDGYRGVYDFKSAPAPPSPAARAQDGGG